LRVKWSMSGRLQRHLFQGQTNRLGLFQQAKGKVRPHKKCRDQRRIFPVAFRCSRNEVGKTGFISTDAGAGKMVPQQRAPTVPQKHIADFVDGPNGLLTDFRTKRRVEVGAEAIS
jgi:hypothetical protein